MFTFITLINCEGKFEFSGSVKMSVSNPFSSEERDHFPNFDAVFKAEKNTPRNSEVARVDLIIINQYRHC